MKDITLKNDNGVRHAYAYGHAKKEIAASFKDAIKSSENKSETAKTFKEAIIAAQTKSETNTEVVE